MKNPEDSPATRVRLLEIDDAREGQRLDNYLLGLLKGVPKSHVYRLLRKGEVRVNRGRAKPDYRLQAGDIIRVPPVRLGPAPQRLQSVHGFDWLEERILHEDGHLIAVNKPAGLAVHGGSGVSVGLIEAMRALRPDVPTLELVHRLDRDTSGCLLLAKTRPALLALHRLLKEGGVHKYYLALVKGRWRGGPRDVSAALETAARKSGERRVQVAAEGKASASRIVPQQVFGQASLVEIELLTGRTHQARVHTSHLGHPIAGDDKYGDWDFNRVMRAYGLNRLFLHAARLEFRHPQTGSKLRLDAPLPQELAAVLKRIPQ
jgi:23S rRNA pseudouridine955/2504/2580 synthase